MAPKKELEERTFQKLEQRTSTADPDNPTVTISGYAIVWDVDYPIGGGSTSPSGFDERVSRGAATKSLKEKADVRLLINHEGVPLARSASGTLNLEEDEIGLRVDADLSLKNPRVQELHSAMERGDIDNMSFRFWPTRQEWSDDYTKRNLKEIGFDDVSIVTYPASEATLVKVRSAAQEEARPVAPITTPILDELRTFVESLKN